MTEHAEDAIGLPAFGSDTHSQAGQSRNVGQCQDAGQADCAHQRPRQRLEVSLALNGVENREAEQRRIIKHGLQQNSGLNDVVRGVVDDEAAGDEAQRGVTDPHSERRVQQRQAHSQAAAGERDPEEHGQRDQVEHGVLRAQARPQAQVLAENVARGQHPDEQDEQPAHDVGPSVET